MYKVWSVHVFYHTKDTVSVPIKFGVQRLKDKITIFDGMKNESKGA